MEVDASVSEEQNGPGIENITAQSQSSEKKQRKKGNTAEDFEVYKKELATRFNLEGFTVIQDPLKLVPSLQTEKIAFPRPGPHPRAPSGKLLDVFFSVNNYNIFDHIANKTTEYMDEKVRTHQVNGQLAHRYYTKAVTRSEIVKILGLQYIFRGRKNINSIEEQFSRLPEELSKWPIKEKRYKAIMSSLDCNFEELCDLLRSSWKNAIEPGTHFCVDETMYDYHSRKDEGSPQRYIPRKPHKNGLLSYMAVFKTDEGPYIFDLETDHNKIKLPATEALRRIVSRWEWDSPKHVVVDAGFSGAEVQQTQIALNCFMTSSVNIMHKEFTYNLLKTFCPFDKWMAVKDKNGIVWSLYRENEKAEHFISTTAFTDDSTTASALPMRQNEIKVLMKLGNLPLSILGNLIGLQVEGDIKLMATSIASKINQFSSQQNVPSNTIENPIASTSESANKDDPVAELSKLTLPLLKEKAQELNIKSTGKNKAKLIEEIKTVMRMKEDVIESTMSNLSRSTRSTEAPHHIKYKSEFNGVDLHDRYWYYQKNHHSLFGWRSKFTLCLLQSAMINSMVVHKHFDKHKNGDYLLQLSIQLCES